MKNKINNYIVLLGCLLIVLGSVSCTDYLDREPDSILDEKEVFKNFTNFQGFVEEMYMLLPDMAKHSWCASFNWGDDEHQYTGAGRYILYKFDRGDFKAYINDGECFLDRSGSLNNRIHGEGDTGGRFGRSIWSGSWYGIRKCNLGIDAIERGMMIDATQEERDFILGQLYFFRGFFHFQLMQYWGPMPYIDVVLSSSEKLELPRPATYRECAERAGEDLRKAADYLPVNWDKTVTGRRTEGNNELRANKIWALGFLGKNYLWAGSPLMTHGAGGPKTYDKDLCAEAAKAFAELLDLVQKGQTQYSLVDFENYSNLFYTINDNWKTPGSTEAIMRGPNHEVNARWRQSVSYYPMLVQLNGDPERLYPCANYVNFFGMENGLPLEDADSEFDKTHPWKGRDPRFYYNFVYDGVQVVTGQITPARNESRRFARLYTGGSYRTGDSPSETGYCLKKFITVEHNSYDKGGDDFADNFSIMLSWLRLADVYLMYAESAAQAYGGANGKFDREGFDLTAVEAINKVRERAGVKPVNSKYTGSLDLFMSELRRERAVELAYEAHRFNDLRRWLLLAEKPYTIKTRQEFQRVGAYATDDVAVYDPLKDPNYNPKENEVSDFREEILLERPYTERHYWLPLKNDDIYLYEGFPQNPGW